MMLLPLVILVEDDTWLAASYQRVLGDTYRTKVVTSASEAIDLIDDDMPAVIIADMLLEGGSAIDLMHELQSYSDTGQVPIIVCSGLAAQLSLDDLRTYGVVAIKDKATLTPEMLRQEVEAACNLRKAAP